MIWCFNCMLDNLVKSGDFLPKKKKMKKKVGILGGGEVQVIGTFSTSTTCWYFQFCNFAPLLSFHL